MLPEEGDPLPSWEDLSPSEQTDIKLVPLTLGLLVLLVYILFGTGP